MQNGAAPEQQQDQGVLGWFKGLFRAPEQAGPQRVLRRFTVREPTLTQEIVLVEQEAWRVDVSDTTTVRLFEVREPGVDQCMLTYMAELRTADLHGRAYLEMWCHLPGRGEFFSKGFDQAVKGTTDWTRFQLPFFLRKAEAPDLVKLNVVAD